MMIGDDDDNDDNYNNDDTVGDDDSHNCFHSANFQARTNLDFFCKNAKVDMNFYAKSQVFSWYERGYCKGGGLGSGHMEEQNVVHIKPPKKSK